MQRNDSVKKARRRKISIFWLSLLPRLPKTGAFCGILGEHSLSRSGHVKRTADGKENTVLDCHDSLSLFSSFFRAWIHTLMSLGSLPSV